MFQNYSQIHRSKRLALYWVLLSFQAGLINAGALISCGRYVSHITGNISSLGMEWGKRGAFGSELWVALSSFLAFVGGVVITSLFLEYPRERIEETQRKYRYPWVFLLMSALLGSVSLFGEWGYFGAFQAEFAPDSHFYLLLLLSLMCGLQNGLFSDRSGVIIRTTHLTGVASDLGIGLVRVFSKRGFDPSFIENEKIFNYLRIFAIFYFMLGAAVSMWVFPTLGYLGFLVPFCCSLLFFIDSFKIRQSLRVR